LLRNGQDISCTLGECLDPLKGLESAGQGPGNHTFQHQVRTLVSFHVWACQSIEDRDRFLESAHDRQVTVQAAVLRSVRHLMIQRIKQKSLSSQTLLVQEHVQNGAYVLTQDQFMNQNYNDKSQSRGADRDKVRNKDSDLNGERGRGRGRSSNECRGRGMDIERVLRACKEAVQSNNTSLQFIKDSQIY
jgi:hypothetical protein